jgi:hypothetical protein
VGDHLRDPGVLAKRPNAAKERVRSRLRHVLVMALPLRGELEQQIPG